MRGSMKLECAVSKGGHLGTRERAERAGERKLMEAGLSVGSRRIGGGRKESLLSEEANYALTRGQKI